MMTDQPKERNQTHGGLCGLRGCKENLIYGILSIIVAFALLYVCFVTFYRDNQWLCNLRVSRYGKVPDSIERYVLVGYGDKPECPLPGDGITVQVKLGEPTSIWVRSVYYDHVAKAAEETKVVLDVVTGSGRIVAVQAPDFLLNPSVVTTNQKKFSGFYDGNIVFVAQKQDIYRIRATYSDRGGLTRYSLGPLIIVH